MTDPDKRMSLQQMRNHPWLSQAIDSSLDTTTAAYEELKDQAVIPRNILQQSMVQNVSSNHLNNKQQQSASRQNRAASSSYRTREVNGTPATAKKASSSGMGMMPEDPPAASRRLRNNSDLNVKENTQD